MWERACSGDCGLDRCRRPAKAPSRPRPLPQEMRPTRGRGRFFVGGVFRPRRRRWTGCSAWFRPRRQPWLLPQGMRPPSGRRRLLWEGSSDPDSDGGQCAAPGSGPGGSHACLPQSALAQFLERSLWERACSRLRP